MVGNLSEHQLQLGKKRTIGQPESGGYHSPSGQSCRDSNRLETSLKGAGTDSASKVEIAGLVTKEQEDTFSGITVRLQLFTIVLQITEN